MEVGHAYARAHFPLWSRIGIDVFRWVTEGYIKCNDEYLSGSGDVAVRHRDYVASPLFVMLGDLSAKVRSLRIHTFESFQYYKGHTTAPFAPARPPPVAPPVTSPLPPPATLSPPASALQSRPHPPIPSTPARGPNLSKPIVAVFPIYFLTDDLCLSFP